MHPHHSEIYTIDMFPQYYLLSYQPLPSLIIEKRDRRGRDRMVAGFMTTYAISAYNH